MEEIASINLSKVKQDIYRGIAECTKRGLIHSAKWLAGMNHGLETGEKISPAQCFQDTTFANIADNEFDDYMLAKTFFDVQEYDRSAYFTQNCVSAVPKFLHLYATYMSKEKKRLDNLADTSHMNQTGCIKELSELLTILKAKYSQRSMDAYLLYLYGVVLKKLDLNDLAITVLLESVHAEPVLWSSWVELVPLISDRDKLANLNLPDHWMKQIFIGHAYIDLFLNDEGLKIYDQLQKSGFAKNVYIQSQIAIAHHNNRSECHRARWERIEFFLTFFSFDFRCRTGVDDFSRITRNRSVSPGHLGHVLQFVVCERSETRNGLSGAQSGRNQ